jgi:hypothetical protein
MILASRGKLDAVGVTPSSHEFPQKREWPTEAATEIRDRSFATKALLSTRQGMPTPIKLCLVLRVSDETKGNG